MSAERVRAQQPKSHWRDPFRTDLACRRLRVRCGHRRWQ